MKLKSLKTAAQNIAGISLVGLLLASNAAATSLTLVNEPVGVGPQSASAPCIIAGTNCQNPTGFDYTDYDQTIDTVKEFSPLYNINDFPFWSFDVAIDVNTNSADDEVLFLFEVRLNSTDGERDGTLLYSYVSPNGSLIGTPLANNGNGFGDWTLRSIDLTSYLSDPTNTIQFYAHVGNAKPGAESFFLVAREPGGSEVPEPATMALLASGVGLPLLRARRRNKAAK